jgi:arginase
MGGPMRLCGYAAEMLRDEFARQKQKRLQIQWHMLYPENRGSKEEKLTKLIKAISHNLLNAGQKRISLS